MEIQLRRCVGSTRYAIEAHEAPVTDLPAQPSGRDGLGRMCRPHWRAYTSALRQDQLARSGAPAATTEPVEVEQPPKAERPAQATKPTRATRATVTKPVPERVRRAKAVIDTVEHLGGTAYTEAVASDEVQEALEVSAAAAVGRTVDVIEDAPTAA